MRLPRQTVQLLLQCWCRRLQTKLLSSVCNTWTLVLEVKQRSCFLFVFLSSSFTACSEGRGIQQKARNYIRTKQKTEKGHREKLKGGWENQKGKNQADSWAVDSLDCPPPCLLLLLCTLSNPFLCLVDSCHSPQPSWPSNHNLILTLLTKFTRTLPSLTRSQFQAKPANLLSNLTLELVEGRASNQPVMPSIALIWTLHASVHPCQTIYARACTVWLGCT